MAESPASNPDLTARSIDSESKLSIRRCRPIEMKLLSGTLRSRTGLERNLFPSFCASVYSGKSHLLTPKHLKFQCLINHQLWQKRFLTNFNLMILIHELIPCPGFAMSRIENASFGCRPSRIEDFVVVGPSVDD